MAILRNAKSSFCANTGAVGVLVVNGQPTAQGDLTEVGSSIQASVSSGDVVAAIIHTVPKFNEISCIRLGELSVALLECDPAYQAIGGKLGGRLAIPRSTPERTRL